jgi:hypothetical protein
MERLSLTQSPVANPAAVKLVAAVTFLVGLSVLAMVMTELAIAAFIETFSLMAQPHCAFTPTIVPQGLTVAATKPYVSSALHLRHDNKS